MSRLVELRQGLNGTKELAELPHPPIVYGQQFRPFNVTTDKYFLPFIKIVNKALPPFPLYPKQPDIRIYFCNKIAKACLAITHYLYRKWLQPRFIKLFYQERFRDHFIFL